jgi:ribosome biogenesis GTPase A
MIAVNKIDLLPRQTPLVEVSDYLNEYLNSFAMSRPLEIIAVSGLKGAGIDKLLQRIKAEVGKDEKIALVGATNVGKSSLVKRILAMEGTTGTPTISKFPGTTLGLSNWGILKGRNTLIDTPGLNPGNRLGDILCPQCGSIYTAERLERKLWGIKPGKGLIMGGIFGIENLSDAEMVLLAFAAEGTHFHRTDNAKLQESVETQPDWLRKLCKG